MLSVMLSKQKKLYNVRAENVLRYIYDLVKSWGNLGKVVRLEYIYLPFPVEKPKDNRIEVKVSLVKKGDDTEINLKVLRNPINNLTAVVFEAWQLMDDTVLLRMSYLEIGLPVSVIWSNIMATFSKQDEDHTETKQAGKPPRLVSGKRLNEWRSIWRFVKNAYRGGGRNYADLVKLLPKSSTNTKRKLPSPRLMADIIKAAEYYEWE